ncbi:MAG: 16S rRNA (adenine(1518)-N(6)/adenine(1519)-N(6))-dimethyltransferase RsmA [Tissierellia bacterium]|jgi:16S rRNA (adenine1518-N6/adenine1519-N6)-dimethyltransferase|nr:16S rRNA (adenine(1518)-N(6)/adenine(1519)-N(6))-dimethyltransferase RsmA [Tissierellia bacterium]HPB80245.1 16S rRNA (adenine(1518)-N(6)/adenine(1519)-N(6))-dimethyltransferase RsmA [Sedimentibacter sp.]HQO72789.1 16S rRNA (adenine(1518)-N(6)/adenine(1519)-N(6))-dimethyltransferase RsmA [Sedimentibacter sp.]
MDEIKLYSPKVIKDILDRYGFKFSKSLGQNFLIDGNIIKRIVEIAGLDEKSGVLEIGPGFGTLTQLLCKKANKVIAIEVDKSLIEVHKGTLDYPNLKIIYDDFLKVDVNKLIEEEFKGLDVKIVANLPYYITTPIIMKILEEKYKVSKIVVMVQKEMAQRLNSKPGTKDYGAITLAVQYRADTNIAMIVPNSVFMPKPKVDSAVIEFRILPKPRIDVCDEKMLFEVIKASFAQRRKTILNGLSNSLNFSKDIINESLVSASINPGIRGEKLTLEEFGRISDEISKRVKD